MPFQKIDTNLNPKQNQKMQVKRLIVQETEQQFTPNIIKFPNVLMPIKNTAIKEMFQKMKKIYENFEDDISEIDQNIDGETVEISEEMSEKRDIENWNQLVEKFSVTQEVNQIQNFEVLKNKRLYEK